MTDTTSRDADTMRHDGLDAVSPVEAARRLGITPDSVRARLRRGTIQGERRSGEWVVFLPPAPDAPAADAPRDTDTTHRATRHDADTTERDTLIAAKDETIESQRGEIAFLRAQLDQARRDQAAERERFDVIHREALARIEALSGGELERDENHHDAPDDARAGRGEELPPNMTGNTLQAADERSHVARWLSRLLGRS